MTTLTAGTGNFMTAGTWTPSQVPTAADDCLLTVASGAVTIDAGSVCRSLNLTGYVNTLTHTAGVTLTIGDATAGLGSVALAFPASGWTYTLGNAITSAITFVSTSSTQQTVNFGGKATGSTTYNAASNGSWLYTGGQGGVGTVLTLTKGSLNLNGQTIAGGTLSSSNTNVRALTLGSAALTFTGLSTGWDLTTVTGLTFSGASATITASGSFNGGNQAYGTVNFTGSLMSGSNSFTTLAITGPATKVGEVRFSTASAVQTIGTLSANGNSIINRLLLRGNAVGVNVTLNVTTISSATNLDFRDVIAGGAADWNFLSMTGGSGDCGGNSGITFTAATTQTSTGTASFSWSTHGWTSRVPLPQDDVVISNAFVAGRVVTMDMPRAGKNITWTGATGTPTWTLSTASTVYGSITKIAGMLQTGTAVITLEPRSPITFTNAGIGWTNPLTIAAFGTTVTLSDAFTSTGLLSHLNGNFIDAGFATTFTTFTSNSGLTRTLTRTGSMTLTGTGAVFTITSAGLTYSGTGATMTISDPTQGTSKTLAGGGITTFGALVLSGKNIIITGANTFASIALNNLGDTTGVAFPGSTTTTVTGAFTSTSASGNAAKIISSTGAAATLSKSSGIVSIDYASITNSAATGGAQWFAGANGVNVSGNTGWIFTVPTIIVAPTALALALSSVNPSVRQSSLSLSPAALALVLATVNPGVVLSSLGLTPAVLSLAWATVNPGVSQSSLTLTPLALVLALATVNPQVYNALAISPAALAMALTTVNPSILLALAPTPEIWRQTFLLARHIIGHFER